MSLEEKISKLHADADRVLGYFGAMNLQSAYNHGLDTGDVNSVPSRIFSQTDSRVKTDIGGVYEGQASLRRMWNAMGNHLMTAKGVLGTVMVSTPYIYVSEDGNYAKGIWHGFGPNSFSITPYPGNDEKLNGFWILLKYVDEFVKEDDEWKMLSFHLEMYFRTPYEEGWVKQPDARRFLLPPDIKPDHPVKRFKPYHSHEFNRFYPVPDLAESFYEK